MSGSSHGQMQDWLRNERRSILTSGDAKVYAEDGNGGFQEVGSSPSPWDYGSVGDRKKITSVTVTVSQEPFDSYSYGGVERHISRPWSQDIRYTDQDGHPIPAELQKQLEQLSSWDASRDQVQAVLDRWNNDSIPRPSGHKPSCVYIGNHDYSCSCQPPTIFGPTDTWHCECCERPRATERYGLCDLCDEHQYSQARAEADHDALEAV
jgi:hypothetical protein